MTTPPKAIILLSGGLDSAVTLAIAKAQGFNAYALSFRYGQRHLYELEAAQRVAEYFNVSRHLIIELDLTVFGGSALMSGTGLDIPKRRSEVEISQGVPITYVPARNTILLSYALAWSEVLPAPDIFVGVNVLDYSGYPDCRPEYIKAYERVANLGSRAGVEEEQKITIHTPLIKMKKSEIIRQGAALGVDFSITSTCYDPSPTGKACGHCDACLLRLKGFQEVGLEDPAAYVST